MFNQISAVVWKEAHELFQQRGLRGALFNWLIMVGLGGIFIPLQSEGQWFSNPFFMIVWAWLPMISVMQIVSDTFAGERERHTLETLLASKLTDQAILWGKVLSVVLYGWSIQFASLILAAVVENIATWTGSIQFYTVTTLVGLVPLIMLLIVLVAAFGTLVSLRSATVRSAYQKMMIGFFILIFGFSALAKVMPGWITFLESIQDIKLPTLLLGSLGLLLIDSILIMVGASRFKRETLISQL
jgi:ABC-2 type transport system permease protein